MKNILRQITCISMVIAITVAYAPLSLVWATEETSVQTKTEEAVNDVSSVAIEEDVENEDTDTVTEDSLPEENTEQAMAGAGGRMAMEGFESITVDPDIENGEVVLTASDSVVSGTATPDTDYDLSTVRQIWTDGEGVQHEQYLEYTESNGSYTFEADADIVNSVITAHFFSLKKWDGAVDITWYDPDKTEFEIGTPAELAGLAAITNGMVDENITSEWMIKDTAGRSFSDGVYRHEYISTEPWLVDLLTPGTGDQVRDTAWRLPEVEHRKIAEDDIHNDFLYRTVKLTADIDMGDKNWTPIGGKYAMNKDATDGVEAKVIDTRFQGVLDGEGHTITLNCNRKAAMGFAYAMEIAFIGYLGGGIDYANGYAKDTCADYANVWVPAVRNIVVKGSIEGRRMVGGVVGRIGETEDGVLIENCANYASVSATDMRGCAGIVGAAWGKSVIRNCYNAGTIHSAYWEHGGIVGSNGYEGSENKSPAGADIFNCYNVGEVRIYDRATESWKYDGQEIGVDGGSFASYKVANCFYEAPGTAIEDKTGYSIGESTKNNKVRSINVRAADLKSDEILAALNSNGEVFSEDTNNINNGYPVLYFQQNASLENSTITLEQTAGGNLSSDSKLTNLPYGTIVELKAEPDKGKRLTGYKVSDGVNESTFTEGDFYSASGRDVTVSAEFSDRIPSELALVEENDGAHYYVKVEKIKDADGRDIEPVRLYTGDTVEMNEVIRVTPVDIDLLQTQPDIKYLEYTGGFSDPVVTRWALDEKKKIGSSYTFKVTGDTDRIEISFDPKTQGKRWTSTADTDWYSDGTKEFTISSAKQLAGVAKLCAGGVTFEGVTIKLGKDIGLENTIANSGDSFGYERSWIGIGTSEKNPFKGTFDGCGHTIKYMHRNFAPGYSEGGNGGLFGVTDGAVIRNVNVVSGAYVNDASVTMECGFINGANGGGIAGTAINTQIENCRSEVMMNKAFAAGGIVGTAEGSTVIKNCTNKGNISGSNESIGGIAGKLDAGSVRIIDCTNDGELTSTSWKVGGILGSGESSGGLIERCVNNGSIATTMKGTSSYAHAAGGIAGYAAAALTISQCINKGDMSGYGQTYAMGGIAGTILRGTISDCINFGNIYSESTSKWAKIGGITNVGTNRLMSAAVKSSYNAGKITLGSGFSEEAMAVGGVAGYGSAATNMFSNAICTDTSVASLPGRIGKTAGIAGTVVSESVLKTNPSSVLGDNYAPDRNNVNGGFPVLAWQDPTAICTMNSIAVPNNATAAVNVSWSASGPRTGFELQRSVNGGAYSTVYRGEAASYTDKSVSAGNKYTYKVRGYRTEGSTSSYSEWKVSNQTEILLAAMKLKSVKNKKGKKAEVKWKRVKDAKGYEIYRSTAANGNYAKVKTVKVTKKLAKKKTLSFINKKLKKKKTYYFKIRYYKTVGGKKVYSELSPAKKVKIKK